MLFFILFIYFLCVNKYTRYIFPVLLDSSSLKKVPAGSLGIIGAKLEAILNVFLAITQRFCWLTKSLQVVAEQFSKN